MIYKYRTSWRGIRKHLVLKETGKQIVYMDSTYEIREAKISSYHNWFDTFEEAKEYLIREETKKIENCEAKINCYKENINKWMELEDKS